MTELGTNQHLRWRTMNSVGHSPWASVRSWISRRPWGSRNKFIEIKQNCVAYDDLLHMKRELAESGKIILKNYSP